MRLWTRFISSYSLYLLVYIYFTDKLTWGKYLHFNYNLLYNLKKVVQLVGLQLCLPETNIGRFWKRICKVFMKGVLCPKIINCSVYCWKKLESIWWAENYYIFFLLTLLINMWVFFTTSDVENCIITNTYVYIFQA